MYFRFFTATLATLLIATIAVADETENSEKKAGDDKAAVSSDKSAITSGSSSSGGSSSSSSSSSKPSQPKHAIILKDAKPVEGLIRTYRKGNQLFAELSSSDYANQYIVLISIAKGIGQRPLLGGMSWNFGDDWVWQFRKVDDRVHIIRKNVRFRASKNTPEATAVKNAYTDSVLFSLPVLTKGPRGVDLVDLTSVFMSDLPQISQVLPGFAFSTTKSVWDSVKGFKDNLELQIAATYASSGRTTIESVADTRGVTINVHYSISKLPQTSYQPRMADDRVGYFMTVLKDYSSSRDRDHFLRYINRWNLQKADPSAEKSVPKKPVIFWIEKTVPFKYRKPIYDGISEWNKAFEKAGFINAIEVRQQPDDATWDPEDINYNTFRWITASAGFAMGPSRVNPYTGEILDADIIFDSDFLESWQDEFETLTQEKVASLTGGPLDLKSYQEKMNKAAHMLPQSQRECMLSQGMAMQFAFGRAALLAKPDAKQSKELQEKLIMQGLKDIAMHEVGHTLGLRHNFKSSSFLDLEEINNPDKTSQTGITASVMDYTPVNIVQEGTKQGDFYSPTIGPYDYWAIEYGYKQLSGGSKGEVAELKKIAARSGEPGHAYATDEDTRGIDPDPFVNRWDLGKDPLEYARQQAKLVSNLLPGVVDRMTEDGDSYSDARRAFNVLLSTHGQAMFFASRFIGGLDTSRSHKGDKDAPAPFTVIEPKRQREALQLLSEQVFSDKPYQIDPAHYNLLAGSKWRHWGSTSPLRPDFPVHQVILMWQNRVLSQLLSSLTLERLHDAELKVDSSEDAFTTAELIEELTNVIFSELNNLEAGEYTNRKPAITSLRRNLQRRYLARLSSLAMGNTSAPDDCQAVAYVQLTDLIEKMEKSLETEGLDSYTQAHLRASADRAKKVKDASLTLLAP